jgi:hypothetical protein
VAGPLCSRVGNFSCRHLFRTQPSVRFELAALGTRRRLTMLGGLCRYLGCGQFALVRFQATGQDGGHRLQCPIR